MLKKILLIGRVSVGKTSIKDVIFEGKEPKSLIIFPLEPTRGITSSVYSWMDLNLSIFDTSGQELPFLLADEDEQNKAFNNTNAIIYVFDYINWTINSESIIEEILKIFNIMKKYQNETMFSLFFHKIDLINQKFRGRFQIIKSEIQKRLNLPIELPIYFTSLHPNLIFNAFNAFFEILSSLSKETTELKNIIDMIINELPKTICFIANQNNSIIVQSMTKDFDVKIINYLRKIIAKIDYSSKELAEIYNKVNMIDSGPKIISMIMDNLEPINSYLKNIICFSETYDADKLIGLISKLKLNLNKHYKSNELKKI